MELRVEERIIFGKKVKVLRREGFMPAELYGRGLANRHLTVPLKDFKKVFKAAGENTVVTLFLEKEKLPALIQQVVYHPVTDEIESVDFYQVRLDEKIKTRVPLEFVGVPPAVKNKNGVLIKVMQEVEVEALPQDIPHAFIVDVSSLTELNQSVYLKDLPVPARVAVLFEPEAVLATVKEQKTEEEAAPAEKPAVESIVVETEEKKKEREKEKE